MSEDQMYDAAEREMDLYRAEIDRITGQLRETAADNIRLRDLVREILTEVELGTLGQVTAQATTRTLARTAEWRKRAMSAGEELQS